MRKATAIVITAGVLAALTACTGQPAGSAALSSSCGVSSAGENSSSTIDAPGDFGSAPEVTFPSPLVPKKVERSSIIVGDGEPIEQGQPVLLDATILNGDDGSVLQQTPYSSGQPSLLTLGDDGQLPELGLGLECATVGSRVAVVIPPVENPQEGQPTGSVVVVADIVSGFKAKADGADQLPVSGMPAVVTAPDGTPGITVPNESAPSEYRSALLKQGEGERITDDSVVVAKFTAVDWNAKTVVESTWATGSAEVLPLADPAVSDGVRRAVTGQRVGSQVLAVLPPELAATDDAATDLTLVYVIDILGVID